MPQKHSALIIRLMAALCMLTGASALAQDQLAKAVTTSPAADVLVSIKQEVAAILLSANRSTLSAQVTATVKKIHVDVAQSVVKGDVLLSFSTIEAELVRQQADAALSQANAQTTLARSRLARAQKLVDESYVSADQLDDLATQVVLAEANAKGQAAALAVADKALADTIIRAPFDGVITERHAQLGALVRAGSEVIALTQTGTSEVEIQISPLMAKSLQNAVSPRFETAIGAWPAALVRLSSTVDLDSLTQIARLKLSDQSVPAGIHGRIKWESERNYLPTSLLQKRGDHFGVFVAEGDRARFVALDNAQEGRPTFLQIKLQHDVIIEGRELLQDGDRLRISAL